MLEVPRSFKDTRSEDSSGGFGSGGRPLSTYGDSCPAVLTADPLSFLTFDVIPVPYPPTVTLFTYGIIHLSYYPPMVTAGPLFFLTFDVTSETSHCSSRFQHQQYAVSYPPTMTAAPLFFLTFDIHSELVKRQSMGVGQNVRLQRLFAQRTRHMCRAECGSSKACLFVESFA